MSEEKKHIRPGYYNTESQYEPLKVIRAWSLGFELGNVVKYIARAGKKDLTPALADLRKAYTYLGLYIAFLEEDSRKTGGD